MKAKIKSILERFILLRPFLWAAFIYHGERNLFEKKRQIKLAIQEENALTDIQRQKQKNGEDWNKINGEGTLRLFYELNEKSIVFDVGGFYGNWSTEISARYGSIIYIFEPYFPYFEIIRNKFKYNPKVKVFNFGLGARTETVNFYFDNDASSSFGKLITEEMKTEVKIVSIIEFMQQQNINEIDLIKLNIEGGEYELLDQLIINNLIPNFKNFQIQFHDIDNSSESKKLAIRESLAKTHRLTFLYEFFWENWERMD